VARLNDIAVHINHIESGIDNVLNRGNPFTPATVDDELLSIENDVNQSSNMKSNNVAFWHWLKFQKSPMKSIRITFIGATIVHCSREAQSP
jgi:hypothetical protein